MELGIYCPACDRNHYPPDVELPTNRDQALLVSRITIARLMSYGPLKDES